MTARRREIVRWSLSLGVVLVAHAAGAAALLAWRVPHDLPAAPPAVLLDLAPVAAAPAAEANETPPGPKQEITETPTVDTETLARLLPEPEPPEPVPPIEPDRLSEQIPPPEIPPEVVVELPPPKPEPPRPEPPKPEPPEVKPRPVEKPVPRKPKVVQTKAPPAAPSPPAEAAAPPPGIASQPSPDMVRRWQATLVAHLQRHKRYPPSARRDNEEGTAYLRFAMDRTGAVLLKRIERASGHRALDQETLDLVQRAQPLPPPPPDMPGDRFEFVVPVQFHLR
jgi:protein TonB